jgi:Flp pilus assembly protein TadD
MIPRSARGTGRRIAALLLLGALAIGTIAAAATPPAATPKPAAKAPAVKPATGSAKPATGAAKSAAGTTRRAAGAKPSAQTIARSIGDLALDARGLEDGGAYGRAVELLRRLRGLVKPDADLELALALDEARTGQIDSARARIASPILSAAALDTLPVARRTEYPYRREYGWLDGAFDGWHWYVWRARAELAVATGHWSEAYDAALQCVAARPLTGKEWLLLAVAAGRVGHDQEAHEAARQATVLDPTLPEARYLLGLWEWRSGRRSEAQARFREALALDSTFVPAALGMMRSRLPGTPPDSLPSVVLTGYRRAGLLTAPERPKPEEYVQVDVSSLLDSSPDTPVQDSIPIGVKPLRLVLSLLIDEKGRPVINDIPWFPAEKLPVWKVNRLLAAVPTWRFTPAVRLGSPQPIWVSLEFEFNPELP